MPEIFSLRDEVTRIVGDDRLKICAQCGKCVGDCPVAKMMPDQFNPRRLLHKVSLDLKDEVLKGDELWLCTFCYRCQQRCPNEIELPWIFLALRQIALRSGHVPNHLLTPMRIMLKTGRIMEVLEETQDWRESIGLLKLENVSEKALAEIDRILETTGLKKGFALG